MQSHVYVTGTVFFFFFFSNKQVSFFFSLIEGLAIRELAKKEKFRFQPISQLGDNQFIFPVKFSGVVSFKDRVLVIEIIWVERGRLDCTYICDTYHSIISFTDCFVTVFIDNFVLFPVSFWILYPVRIAIKRIL